MNSLEGYSTNGHEYRASEIDRSNSRRLKWMMKEAKDAVNKQDEIKKDNTPGMIADKNITPTLHGNNETRNSSDIRKSMFNPSAVNKFSNIRNSFK